MSKITFEDRIPDIEFIDACNKAISIEELSQFFKVSTSTITRRIDKLGCRKPNGSGMGTNSEYSDEEFINICKNSMSMRQASKKMNIPFTSFQRRAEKLGCYVTNQAGKGIKKEYNSKYNVNEDYFSVWTPQMAYWYGFIVADGGIVPNSKHRFKIRLSSKHEYVLQRFKEDISFTGPILRNTTKAVSNSDKRYSFSDIIVNNKKFVNSLKEKGIVERKTYLNVKYIKYVPIEFRPYFLIGLFDGDGHIAVDSGYISISGNKVNIVSSLEHFGFSSDLLRIENRGNYVNVCLRYIKDCFKFYQIYLKYSKNIYTLDYKRERIEYFYKVCSQRHPEWV